MWLDVVVGIGFVWVGGCLVVYCVFDVVFVGFVGGIVVFVVVGVGVCVGCVVVWLFYCVVGLVWFGVGVGWYFVWYVVVVLVCLIFFY